MSAIKFVVVSKKPWLELVREASAGLPAQYAVWYLGRIVGLLEKYKNTSTDSHPWKAFKGYGAACIYLGAYYPEEGGKKAALARVISEAQK